VTPVERPRVEGLREQAILDATLEVLAEVGYDRLTMDAVAARAKASKATLYRRWTGKATLVVEALHHSKGVEEAPDTGSLRGDLLAISCGLGGLADTGTVASIASIITAIAHDEDFGAAFRAHVLEHKMAATRVVWQRARDRGELRDDVDVDLLQAALPGIVLHRVFVLGEHPDVDLVTRVVDQIILPAATRRPASPDPVRTDTDPDRVRTGATTDKDPR
jgi:AcrR family transcriptional regulator